MHFTRWRVDLNGGVCFVVCCVCVYCKCFIINSFQLNHVKKRVTVCHFFDRSYFLYMRTWARSYFDLNVILLLTVAHNLYRLLSDGPLCEWVFVWTCVCARVSDDCTLLSSFGSRKCLEKLSSPRIRHHSLAFDTFAHSFDALLDTHINR